MGCLLEEGVEWELLEEGVEWELLEGVKVIAILCGVCCLFHSSDVSSALQ